MRADYLPDLFEHSALYDIAKAGADLRVMSEDQLKAAIQRPLQAMHPQAGKRFQDALLKELAHDAAEDAGRLPLLQVTLEDLWRTGILTADHYDDLTDAIRKRADEIYASKRDAHGNVQPRSPQEQERLLKIFLDLVDVSADDKVQRDVRRTRRLADVTRSRESERLVEELATARLLVTDERELGDGGQQVETVDIIHESLLKNWSLLSQAIQAEREHLQQRGRFELRLSTWLENHRPTDRLLQGVDLAKRRICSAWTMLLSNRRTRKDFITRSVHERDRIRRRNQRITAIVAAVLGVLLIAALVAVRQAVIARKDTESARVIAASNVATAQAASTRAVASEGTAVAERGLAQAASTRAVEQQKTAEANNAAEAQKPGAARRFQGAQPGCCCEPGS